MNKKIEVDITMQQLTAYDGKFVVHKFRCVTGAADTPTPRGKYKILKKETIHRSKEFNAQMNYALLIDGNRGIFIHESYNYVEDPVKQSTLATMVSDTAAAGASYIRSIFPDTVKSKITIGGVRVFGSHGCIRLSHSDAVALFNWAEKGTSVEIK